MRKLRKNFFIPRLLLATFFTFLIALITLFITDAKTDPSFCSYSVIEFYEGSSLEYRFYCSGHHFMTIIDEEGTFNIRPRPGDDINGWGSSWYAQPFLPGATLKHSNITSIISNRSGIFVSVSGKVSRGSSSDFGMWESHYHFTHNRTGKKIYGTGQYIINLSGNLNQTTGDLNLYRIASNYLDDVPLQSGGIGDTGDMNQSIAIGNGFNYLWIPPNPGFFPQDTTDYLLVEVTGDYNEVDTKRMGFNFSIAPAYKPTIVVTLNSSLQNIPMIYGAFYDLNHRQDFWEDNIGITPLILRTSQQREFNFTVSFYSEALPGDR